MRYDVMYCERKASARFIKIMDFKMGAQITMTWDEIGQVDQELRDLLFSMENDIKSGKKDYKNL
ncbi:hypothetical protein [Guptibacillus sedimenti]|uniref:hypothetical protein n=1 Tax=Guptibacillus sedimenti TaxID=3025680 RepID=UPI00235FD8F7|nr:hypothetical protein [Pseudalkalibacillus sedimenti]